MTKKALLIGINYIGTSAQLNGCINDVKNMMNLLQNVFQYTEFTVLTDETLTKPTRANIESAMKTFVDSAVAGDELYFHYSGHGAYISDRNGDETDGRDEVLVPLDYNRSGLISDDWIMSEFICKVKRNVKMYSCMDCCHSGTSFDLKYNFRTAIPTSPNQLLLNIERSNLRVAGSIWMFSGCQDPQTAADAHINRMAQGAFTACFIDAVNANLEEYEGQKVLKKMKLREMLREINTRLINLQFEQRSQLSVARLVDCESLFML